MSFGTVAYSQNWVRWQNLDMYSEIDLLLLQFQQLNLNHSPFDLALGFYVHSIKCLISAYEILPISSAATKLLINLYVSEPQELSI